MALGRWARCILVGVGVAAGLALWRTLKEGAAEAGEDRTDPEDPSDVPERPGEDPAGDAPAPRSSVRSPGVAHGGDAASPPDGIEFLEDPDEGAGGTGLVWSPEDLDEEAPAAPEPVARLSPESLRTRLVETIRRTGDCRGLYAWAREAGCEAELDQILVDLLGSDEEDLQEVAHDTLTVLTGEGRLEVHRVNERRDDDAFKEQLLHLIRERLDPESPLLDRVIGAFEAESEPVTRMRIVRAVGKIGGEKARRFLDQVLVTEGAHQTLAAQEARRRLEGPPDPAARP